MNSEDISSPSRHVVVVDDDSSVRRALGRLFKAHRWTVTSFGSAREVLEADSLPQPCCLVLDVRMPGLDGLELQERLAEQKRDIPIVFMTGHGDVPMSVQAMRQGAIHFLPKPFSDEEMLAACEEGFAASIDRLRTSDEISRLLERLQRLTPREREVFGLVVQGLLNKQVGGRLGVSEKTVKVHRARVMQKMEADSLAELVLIAQKLDLVDLPNEV